MHHINRDATGSDLRFHDRAVHEAYLDQPRRVNGVARLPLRRTISGVHSAATRHWRGNASAVPPYILRYGMGGQGSAYAGRAWGGNVKASTMAKGRAFLNDFVDVVFERRRPDGNSRSDPYYKELVRKMFFPARAAPASAPALELEDEDEIKWARGQVGAQGDDPISNTFFKNEATPARLRQWIMFYARVHKKLEDWGRLDKKEYRRRLPLPLPAANRKHMPVDKVILYTILQLTKIKFEETLDSVNAVRQDLGVDAIDWSSLGAPPLPSNQGQFVARPEEGDASCSEKWLRYIFNIEKFFETANTNKEFSFDGVFFYTNAVQVCLLYSKRELNKPEEVTQFDDLRLDDDEDDDANSQSIGDMLADDFEEDVDDEDAVSDDAVSELDADAVSEFDDAASEMHLDDDDDWSDNEYASILASLFAQSCLVSLS